MTENFLYINKGNHIHLNEMAKKFLNAFFYNMQYNNKNDKPIFFCLGNPKFACDIFAPIVGSILQKSNFNTHVFGTLQHPIILKNYKDYYKFLKFNFPKREIIVIDSAYSNPEFWGNLKFSNNGIIAGAGVGNQGDKIGDKSIIANINMISAYNNFITTKSRILLAESLATQCAKIILSNCNYKLNKLIKTTD